ncbi:MAG: FAD-dependent oxidoreductase [Myxococcota bacterium]|jgi:monoamine oxidase|nr:FAD-dependent oxidoreductase [Myxococcota bacterium]
MARTPLFRLLRTGLARAAASSNGTPNGTLEATPNVTTSAGRIGRRALLRTGAIGGAGLALGCRPNVSTRDARDEGSAVVVVGAGLAGLTCAHQLRRAGVRATVYEAQERVGGRVFSGRGLFAGDLVCELGAELVNSDHVVMRGLCRELGLALEDYCDDAIATKEIFHVGGARYTAESADEAFRHLAAALERERARLGGFDLSYRTATPEAAAIDRLSIAEWLDAAEVTGWFRTVVDVAFTTELGRECDAQSAFNLLYLYEPLLEEGRHYAPVGGSDERFHVHGGNDLVATRLAAGLDGQLELGARLEALSGGDGDYTLTFRRGAGAFEVRASHVVLAVPFTTLREVDLRVELPAPKRRAIAELAYGTNTKLMMGFRERPWRTTHGSNGVVVSDLPFQTSWEGSRLQSTSLERDPSERAATEPSSDAGFLVAFTGGRVGEALTRERSGEALVGFVAALDTVFPGVAAARDEHHATFHWPGFAWAKGSYACFAPGQFAAFHGAEAEPVGRLFFAGEHTSSDFQGFMEGAAESGVRAANEVAEALGRSAIVSPAIDDTAGCTA